MITENELKKAIHYCQGLDDPNANDCIKLAAYMTILDHTESEKKEQSPPGYSFSAKPSNAKLAKALENRSVDEIIGLIDELLEAVEVHNPRLYRSFISEL